MPIGSSGTPSNFKMLVFQAEHNILMHPLHIAGVAVYSVVDHCFVPYMDLLSHIVTSSLIHETTEKTSPPTMMLVIYASSNNSHVLHFFLSLLPVLGIWLTAMMGVYTIDFNLKDEFIQLQPICHTDSDRVITSTPGWKLCRPWNGSHAQVV
jgi:photosystem II P680 reaction center D1 protein